MVSWMWAGWMAVAEVPEGIRPAAATLDAPQRYLAVQSSQGATAPPLHCDAAWSGVALLCFRVWEGGQRRWVDQSDLARWGVTGGDLRAAVIAAAPESLAQATQIRIAGMDASYLRIVDGDGGAMAGILRPDLLVERLGGLPIRAALPSTAVLVAWRPTEPDMDKVMAVGAHELFETAHEPISPRVYQWDGRVWLPFGQAVPRTPILDPSGSGPGG